VREQCSVSVVVPTYNRASSLRRLLYALRRVEAPPGGLDVIVVDDGSADDTEAVVERAGFVYVRQKNAGPSAARNRGWRTATGTVIAFTDDDTVPSESWLTDLLEPFADPTVVAVGGSVVPLHPGRLATFVQLERLVDHGVDDSGQVRYLVTANAAFRRSVLEAVGGFDEAFPAAAGEDVDLSMRVARHGKLVRVPGAVVAHEHRLTLGSLLGTYRRHGRARAHLSRKYDDLGTAAPARAQLRPGTWVERFERYRTASGSSVTALEYIARRALGTLMFGFGILEGRRDVRPPVCDVLVVNDIAEIGGAQRVTLDVVDTLAGLGLKAVIASPTGWLSDEARAHGITHVPFRFRARRMFSPQLGLPRPQAVASRVVEAVALRRLMRATGAYWLHSMATVPHVAASIARLGASWRLIWHVNQVHPRFLALLPSPDVVIAPTHAALRPLLWRTALKRRARLCPNRVDLERFGPPSSEERAAAREMLGVSDGSVVVLSASRLEPAKGVHLLVEAAAGITEVVLVVAGDAFGADVGAYVADLRRLAEDRGVDLRLLGARHDVDRLLKGADIAATGSLWEAFGLFAAEAAASGVPVVAFAVGGIPEVIDDGAWGVLVPRGDVLTFRQALETLAATPERRKALGAAAAAGARHRFDDAAFRSALAGVYGRLKE
jgi:glycosyltransferase involved in cell wall biosynthesis